MRSAATVAIVAIVVVAFVAVIAVRDRRDTAIEASDELAVTAQAAVLGGQPGFALAFAREAIGRHDSPQAEDALRQATLADRETAVVRASAILAAWVAIPTPNGRGVVTAGDDGTVRLWAMGRVPTARILTKLASEAIGAAVSPDGKLVASIDRKGTVAVTPISGGRTELIQLPRKRGVYATTVAAVARVFLVGMTNGVIWAVPTTPGAPPQRFGRTPHAAAVLALAVSRDATKLVSTDPMGMTIWDVGKHPLIRIRISTRQAFAAAFSPDGERVATAGADGDLRLWSATTGAEVVPPLPVSNQNLASVRFSPDARSVVVTTAADGDIRITDLGTRTQLTEMPGGSAQYADFSGPDTIVSAGTDGMLRVWTPLAVKSAPVYGDSPSFSPTNNAVVANSDLKSAIHLWNLNTGADPTLPMGDGYLSFAFSPDGKQIVGASPSRGVVYNLATGRSREFSLPHTWTDAVAMTNAGLIAVAGGFAIVVQDLTGAHHIELTQQFADVEALAFSPRGTQLASADSDGTVRLWNPRTGALERVIHSGAAEVRDVSYSRDGTRIVTADSNGLVQIWPLDGRHPTVLAGHVGAVLTAVFNSRGDRVVTGGDDGTVRVWDSAGGNPLVVLLRAAPLGARAAVSPDGKSVVSSSAGGLVVTPCEVCGSLSDVERVAASRVATPLNG